MSNLNDSIPEALIITLNAIWPALGPDGLAFDADPAAPELLKDLLQGDMAYIDNNLALEEPSSPQALRDTQDTASSDSPTDSIPELIFDTVSPTESNDSFDWEWVEGEDIGEGMFEEAMIMDDVFGSDIVIEVLD
ncbi:hypothetical protein FALBO_4866 [Fusarium albosuccineum]|uniref:Uncharacterized protein n=1 Tax=Fusarium albosuccineum TaxID=1237068 RepID=A0A8H4LF25_9HYPO|nr:hypothetical protein FALBO_4866 [Fusarium albosuccineum]